MTADFSTIREYFSPSRWFTYCHTCNICHALVCETPPTKDDGDADRYFHRMEHLEWHREQEQ